MNPQYPYNPSQQYPQQPQMNPGYLPPAQYGGAQAGGNENPDKQSLQQQIKDLEKNLTGDYAYWRYWLQLCLVLSIIAAYPCFVFGFSSGSTRFKQTWCLILALCLFCVSLYAFCDSGSCSKSLKIIRPIYILTIVFWIPCLVFVSYIQDNKNEDLLSLLVTDLGALVFHTVNVIAISKVKKVLEEIERLQIRLTATGGGSFSMQF